MWRDFLQRLCKFSPVKRYHARTALEHPWIIGDHNAELPLTLLDQIN
jgi:serine/threonine protein kinase